jgi:ectoine hydroxylase-related dioxygenase (phytanoyl-CoA dioxygenase family)
VALSTTEIDSFINDGYVALRAAVQSDVVDDVRTAAAELVSPNCDEGWRLGLASVYDLPVLVRAVSAAVRQAFDTLAGQGGWHLAAMWGFPTRLPGAVVPTWHIDGDWFTHHLTSADQVLTPIFLWGDIGSEDSPTLLCPGSHLEVARFLRDAEPDGVPGKEIANFVHSRLRVKGTVEATGAAGDVIVCHPYLAHTVNPTSPRKARYISNVAVHGTAPLNATDEGARLTPVEAAVVTALRS